MGCFSWMTCDTGESIASAFSNREVFTVHMITPDGRVFTETVYDGYGEFGGKDFYELLAELNGIVSDRGDGIDLCFKDNPSGDDTQGVIYPKLVKHLANNIESQYKSLPNPESCPDQGFFYSDEDEEDDDDWEEDDDE